MGRALAPVWDAILRFFELTELEFETIEIAGEVVEEVCHFSEEVYPKEFVAVLAGAVRNHVLHINRLLFQPFTNTETSSQIHLDLPIASGNVGSVHSHPSPSSRPSTQDLRFFSKLGGIHLIICKPFQESDIRAYLCDGTPVSFSVMETAR